MQLRSLGFSVYLASSLYHSISLVIGWAIEWVTEWAWLTLSVLFLCGSDENASGDSVAFSVSVYLCLSVSIPRCGWVFLSLVLSISLILSHSLSLAMSLSPFVCLSLCDSVSLTVSLSWVIEWASEWMRGRVSVTYCLPYFWPQSRPQHDVTCRYEPFKTSHWHFETTSQMFFEDKCARASVFVFTPSIRRSMIYSCSLSVSNPCRVGVRIEEHFSKTHSVQAISHGLSEFSKSAPQLFCDECCALPSRNSVNNCLQ